jgi:predicted pyridoxine 5'-phosphate oxidase superfamily flavin-nucleotide-binding protein
MQNYAELMFTQAVQAFQEADGSRSTYEKMYPERTQRNIGPDEAAFLSARSSIYMATVSQTGWPYIQHRGGPAGFVKMLDQQTIGFADYRGNRQFISRGNLQGDDRVSLFAVDYPRKARLKLQGHAAVIDASENPELAEQLAVAGQGRVERLMTIRIVAMDWNCPQFITPRFDQGEITAMIGPEMTRLQARIEALEAENAMLKETSKT